MSESIKSIVRSVREATKKNGFSVDHLSDEELLYLINVVGYASVQTSVFVIEHLDELAATVAAVWPALSALKKHHDEKNAKVVEL